MATLINSVNVITASVRVAVNSIPLAATGSIVAQTTQYLMCAKRTYVSGMATLTEKVFWTTVSGSIDTTGIQQDRYPTNQLSLIRLVKTIT